MCLKKHLMLCEAKILINIFCLHCIASQNNASNGSRHNHVSDGRYSSKFTRFLLELEYQRYYNLET